MKNFKLAVTLGFTLMALTISACSPDRFGTDDANPSVSSDSETETDTDTDTDTETDTGTDNQLTTTEDCVNGSDDDGDTLIDCDDTDCTSDTTCTTEDCVDVVDNDGDGLTDCDDSDCASDTACLDSSETSCNDGVDNDLDTAIDCDDSDCTTDALCTPTDPTSTGTETASTLSSDYVYSFDPTTDTATTYRVLSSTGSDTNDDASENTTCSLAAPCATLEHIVGLSDATGNIIVFEGSYTNTSSVSLGQHSLYGGFYYDTEGKLAANYTTRQTRLVFQGASTLTLDSSTAVTVEGIAVIGSNTDGAVTITNSSPTIKHARLLSRRGRTYNQVVQINQTGETAMTPVIENSVIISGDTTFDGTQDLAVTPIVIDHSSAGDLSLTMTNSSVNTGRTPDLGSYTSAVAHIFAEGTSATGSFVLQLTDNVFNTSRADISMGVYVINLSSAVITNNQFLMSQSDAEGSFGVVAMGRSSTESFLELTGNLVNIGAAGTSSSTDATNYGISLVDVSLTATNNTIIVSDATSARGISAQMNTTSTIAPSVALKNNFIWVDGNDTRNVYVRNGATLTAFTNNYLLNTATGTGELVNDGTTSYTDLSLLTINSGSLSSTTETDAQVSMRLVNDRLKVIVDATSPLKDAGADSSDYTSEDLDIYGNPRLVNSIVDIGAIEVTR